MQDISYQLENLMIIFKKNLQHKKKSKMNINFHVCCILFLFLKFWKISYNHIAQVSWNFRPYSHHVRYSTFQLCCNRGSLLLSSYYCVSTGQFQYHTVLHQTFICNLIEAVEPVLYTHAQKKHHSWWQSFDLFIGLLLG